MRSQSLNQTFLFWMRLIISRTVLLSAQSIYMVSIVAVMALLSLLIVFGFLAVLPSLIMSAISGPILKRFGSTR